MAKNWGKEVKVSFDDIFDDTPKKKNEEEDGDELDIELAGNGIPPKIKDLFVDEYPNKKILFKKRLTNAFFAFILKTANQKILKNISQKILTNEQSDRIFDVLNESKEDEQDEDMFEDPKPKKETKKKEEKSEEEDVFYESLIGYVEFLYNFLGNEDKCDLNMDNIEEFDRKMINKIKDMLDDI